MKFKHVGEVIDQSWYEALEDAFKNHKILEVIDQIKKDSFEICIKKNDFYQELFNPHL